MKMVRVALAQRSALRDLRLFLLPVAVGLAPGCSHYSQADGKKLEGEVFALTARVKELETKTKTLGDDLKGEVDNREVLSAKVEDLSTFARRGTADLSAQLDSIREDMARVRGLGERLEALETKLNQVVDNLASVEAKESQAAQSEADKQKAVEEALKRERIIADPKALVEEVVRLLNQQQPGEARKLLREAQKRAETDKELAKSGDNIQFLIAETYYLEAKYQLAVSEYNVVRKNFPSSQKVPDALLKMGMCFEQLKYPDDAKLFYQNIRDKYKNSKAAKEASERLKSLK
ncbi:MAG: tetratricopeptide repeat protein [Deltaproteobacteria bacterium]|nr:tetratricopeptide repeat protein [Deltaproteobacteria bacterium]